MKPNKVDKITQIYPENTSAPNRNKCFTLFKFSFDFCLAQMIGCYYTRDQREWQLNIFHSSVAMGNCRF